VDSDSWIGLVGFLICVAIGLFCLYPVLPGRAKKPLTGGMKSMLVGFGVVFIAVGVLALVNLTLKSRTTEHLTVTGKYGWAPGLNTAYRYEIETTRGIYDATDEGVYDALRRGVTYTCRVLSHGYTGRPNTYTPQSTIESCHT
jgi:hypothetical protein